MDIAVVGEMCPWFGEVLSASLAVHRGRLGADRFLLHDLVGIAALFEPGLFDFRRGDVRIETNGSTGVVHSTLREADDARHRVAVSVKPSLRDKVWPRVVSAVERHLHPGAGIPSEAVVLNMPDFDDAGGPDG